MKICNQTTLWTLHASSSNIILYVNLEDIYDLDTNAIFLFFIFKIKGARIAPLGTLSSCLGKHKCKLITFIHSLSQTV